MEVDQVCSAHEIFEAARVLSVPFVPLFGDVTPPPKPLELSQTLPMIVQEMLGVFSLKQIATN